MVINHLIDVGDGVISSGFMGVIKVILFNHLFKLYLAHIGDKFSQLILHKIERCIFVESDDLTWTERGTKGFGSSSIWILRRKCFTARFWLRD